MRLYKKVKFEKTSLEINESVEGERIEKKIERLLNNDEGIDSEGSKEPLYTSREMGVIPEYDIRADKFEAMIDETEKVTEAMRNGNKKRAEERANKSKKIQEKDKNEDSSATPIATE